ncbi:MAG TPA: ABC transporter permease subunit [Patescibacteria group bacterium]|nr:ABC transporter permease subunit [Patescibacteria group bacterium]
MSRRRIRAIVWKELREFRRNRSVVVALAIFPLIFLIQPLVAVLISPIASAGELSAGHVLLYMLAIPVLTPAMLAGYAVAGERQQGSLEPVLTTPIRREEFLLGKALAILGPSVATAYAVYAFFVACVAVLADPDVAAAVLQAPDILAQVLFTPLLAAWSIWVGIAISTRSSDVRVAQQLSLLGSLPLVVVTSLIAFGAIHVTLGLAIGLAALLVLADALGWRVVAPMFDRERLITGR